MKKILTVLLAFMALALCASCGGASSTNITVTTQTKGAVAESTSGYAVVIDADEEDGDAVIIDADDEDGDAVIIDADEEDGDAVAIDADEEDGDVVAIDADEEEGDAVAIDADEEDGDAVVIDADEEDGDTVVIDADEVDPDDEIQIEVFDIGTWYWKLDATITQKESFGDFANIAQGMYADYYFQIKIRNASTDMEEDYASWVESSITIDTDELADRLLSEMLGGEVSGMGLGSISELNGKFTSLTPYYLDDNGYPVTPDFDENHDYIWPEGKEAYSQQFIYINEIANNWVSPIRDKNGQTVQPPAGSYLIYDAFKMEFTGATYHALVGSAAEDVVYDVDLFAVIESPTGKFDFSDYSAKVYLKLTTSQNHSVWLEGEGTFALVDEID